MNNWDPIKGEWSRGTEEHFLDDSSEVGDDQQWRSRLDEEEGDFDDERHMGMAMDIDEFEEAATTVEG